jgi:hypothetical protein
MGGLRHRRSVCPCPRREIKERKLQLRNRLALEERAPFPQQADERIDGIPLSGLAERIECNALRALDKVIED